MPADGSKPRVLIVDDNVHNVDLLLRQLTRNGYTDVATAQTAAEAMALLPHLLPEAILVDLDLPALDGHSLLHHIRSCDRWALLPVLMVTGRHTAPSIRAATQEGANGFIHQPFNGLEIIYKIEQAVCGVAARAAELADVLDHEGSSADPLTARGL